MRDAAAVSGVELVTGETKVVDRGKGDGLFINTAGIGLVPDGTDIRPRRAVPGDVVLLSGDIRRHGIAVLSVREGLAFETSIESDCAPVAELVGANLDRHCLRDPTRGGLATAINELALDGGVGVERDEAAIPVDDGVAGACEILGIDPLYVACEGRMLAVVAEAHASKALELLRRQPLGAGAAFIGRIVGEHPGAVVLRTRLGSRRLLDLLSGEQLLRRCPRRLEHHTDRCAVRM